MNIRIVLLLVLIVFTSCKTSRKVVKSTGQTINSPVESKNKLQKDTKVENALLWKIESPNSKPSYLFGTIHIIPREDFFYPKGTLKAIESSEQMFFEVDMSIMNDMTQQMKMMQKALMKDGKKLSDLLSEDDYKIVQDHFKSKGLPLAMFERMKPAFLSIFASDDMNPTSLQSGEMKSYEMEFMKLAEAKGMSSGGLETIEYQLSVFDKIPYEQQAQMLVDGIKQSENDELKELIELYKKQDLSSMEKSFTDEKVGDVEALLDTRNKNWIPVMIKEMSDKSTFFAVGAGHLVGKNGVVNLLRQSNYTVTPLSIEE